MRIPSNKMPFALPEATSTTVFSDRVCTACGQPAVNDL